MTPIRRVRLIFAVLVTLTVLSVGVVGIALGWPASPAAGVAVAVAGTVASIAGGLALRVLVVAGRTG